MRFSLLVCAVLLLSLAVMMGSEVNGNHLSRKLQSLNAHLNSAVGSSSSPSRFHTEAFTYASQAFTTGNQASGMNKPVGGLAWFNAGGLGELWSLTYAGAQGGRGGSYKLSVGAAGTAARTNVANTPNTVSNSRSTPVLHSDGNFYGTSEFSSSLTGLGTVWKMSTTGTVTLVRTFAGGTTDASNPWGSIVVLSDGTLVGTGTTGGANGKGAIWRMSTAGASPSLVYSFSGTDGQTPKAGLLQHPTDGWYYGTTSAGGSAGFGVIYKINPLVANSYTKLYDFTASGNGRGPQAELIYLNGLLYGTTFSSDTSSTSGRVFSFDPSTNAVTYLTSLQALTNWGNVEAGLVESDDGWIVGVSSNVNNGFVFRVFNDGTQAEVLKQFSATDGSNPTSTPFIAPDGNVYGGTSAGGANSVGVTYKISTAFPVNCNYVSANTTCSATCGGGTKVVGFGIVWPNANGGTACPTNFTESCNTQACSCAAVTPPTGFTVGTCGSAFTGSCDLVLVSGFGVLTGSTTITCSNAGVTGALPTAGCAAITAPTGFSAGTCTGSFTGNCALTLLSANGYFLFTGSTTITCTINAGANTASTSALPVAGMNTVLTISDIPSTVNCRSSQSVTVALTNLASSPIAGQSVTIILSGYSPVVQTTDATGKIVIPLTMPDAATYVLNATFAQTTANGVVLFASSASQTITVTRVSTPVPVSLIPAAPNSVTINDELLNSVLLGSSAQPLTTASLTVTFNMSTTAGCQSSVRINNDGTRYAGCVFNAPAAGSIYTLSFTLAGQDGCYSFTGSTTQKVLVVDAKNLTVLVNSNDRAIQLEASRAIAAESVLANDINSEVTRATTAESAETTRATAAETTLTNALNSEVSRAQAAEQANADATSAEATRAIASETQLNSNIVAESTRATTAEGQLAQSIATEQTRATTAESAINAELSNEIARALRNESNLEAAINAETTRATNAENAEQTRATTAESGLSTQLSSLSNDLSSEVTRATTSENSLSASLNNEVTRATTAESAETTRATAAETTLTNALNSEVSRAQAAEQANADATSAEATRAIASETQLNSNIVAESTRATTAETTLTNNLASESARAQQAELVLNNAVITESLRAIGTEVAENIRAIAAETALQQNINAENTRAVAAELNLDQKIQNETQRATFVENAIIRVESSDTLSINSRIDSEINRAVANENQLLASINALSARLAVVESVQPSYVFATLMDSIRVINAKAPSTTNFINYIIPFNVGLVQEPPLEFNPAVTFSPATSTVTITQPGTYRLDAFIHLARYSSSGTSTQSVNGNVAWVRANSTETISVNTVNILSTKKKRYSVTSSVQGDNTMVSYVVKLQSSDVSPVPFRVQAMLLAFYEPDCVVSDASTISVTQVH